MNHLPAIAQNLRLLMDRHNEECGISENALSRATYERFGEENGVPQPTIHRILAGISKDPKSRTIRRLAEFFNVRESQLRGDEPLLAQFKVSDIKACYLASGLPILTWEQAGRLNGLFEEIQQGAMKVPFETTRKVGPKTFALVVQGDAMHGSDHYSFPEGTRIIVDPSLEAGHGSFVVAKATGYPNPILRRLEIEGGIHRLIPLNKRPGYEIITMTPNDHIIGKVIEYYGWLL